MTFNPDWLARIENLRSLRFMDWMSTNGSTSTTWEKRAAVQDYSYIRRGVPAEVMIELSNFIGADPWFNMPHMADDAYFKAFAELTESTLRKDLRAYVEYSNEVWNFIFPQAVYAREQARLRGSGGGSGGVNVVMNISTPDVEGFRRSQSQIAAQMGRVLARGNRNR